MVTAGRPIRVPFWRELILSLVLLLIVSAALGCGGPQKKKTERQDAGPVLYPLPPDPPRIQYLRSFRTSRDVGEKPGGFASFILGSEADRVKVIDKPWGVAIHDGVIYVADIHRGLFTLDLKERRFGTFRGSGQGRLAKPVGIFIEPDGTKYIIDAGRRQVVVFDAEDRYKLALGDGEDLKKPTDAVVSGDRVYVADIENHNIRVYNKQDGTHLFTIGGKGWKEGKFHYPANVAVDAEGNLYVSDLFNFRIQKFDRDGNFLMKFGVAGDAVGTFHRPKGVAVDRDGIIYVVDAAFEKVQLFNQEGQVLMFFGGGGGEPGSMALPAKVVIDYDNVPLFQQYVDKSFEVEYLVLVTNQFGLSPVSVYGFGSMKE